MSDKYGRSCDKRFCVFLCPTVYYVWLSVITNVLDCIVHEVSQERFNTLHLSLVRICC